jgi:hypothetical protein
MRGLVKFPAFAVIAVLVVHAYIDAGNAQEQPSPIQTLAVTSDPAGGVRATASLLFPVPPGIIQSLLTEYRKWPELFEVRMRLAGVEEREGRVVTDLYIEHALMPGVRRLVCESETLPTGGLVTNLKSGDFKRYHRVWKLKAADEGLHTRADFDLVVEIDTIIPDWVIAMAMRRELEAHFRIVKERAMERARKEK